MAGLLDTLRGMAGSPAAAAPATETAEERRKRREREAKEAAEKKRQAGRGSEYHRENQGMENEPGLIQAMKKLVRPRNQ